MKILNLYAGIGGNRKLWGDDHEITAVEWKENIANIYRDFFPKDRVVVANAHGYLLENYAGEKGVSRPLYVSGDYIFEALV